MLEPASKPDSSPAGTDLSASSLPGVPQPSPAACPATLAFNSISVTVENGLMSITLGRPQVLNSINEELVTELLSAVEQAGARADVRAVLLTGSGRGFCAGQELSPDVLKAAPDLEPIVAQRYNPLIAAIKTTEKPILCAVNGIAAGAGATLALACDVVIAAKDAVFIQAFSKIGLIPDGGGTYTLPRLVGFGRAAGLMMFADKISADEALSMGMIYKVVESDKLAETAKALASRLANEASAAHALTKRALNGSLTNDLAAQLALEAKLQGEAGRTEDFKEGVRAFLEKRKPDFKGR